MADDLKVFSPLDGRLIATLPKDSRESIAEKVQKAQAAQVSWRAVDLKKRSAVFFRYLCKLHDHKSELADLIHRENGKTLVEAHAEMDKVIELTEFAYSLPQHHNQHIMEVSRGVSCEMHKRPLGVVAQISPFNFPLMIPHWTVPVALMCGNAVVLKPSEEVPLSAQKMHELLCLAGLDPDLFCLVHGGRESVHALLDQDLIQAVSFVGSTPVASEVYRRATAGLKRALCMGGAKNHLIAAGDADVDMAAKDIVASFTGMAGQRCMAASVLVLLAGGDKLLERIVEEARRVVPGKNLGAIISLAAKERIETAVSRAESLGARVVLDGRAAKSSDKMEGFYLGPTILDGVLPDWDIWREEVFGPVLSVIRVDSLDEAFALQNSSPFGNAASIYTSQGGVARRACQSMQAGMLGINIGVPVPREPFSFGGSKLSKFGAGDITGPSSIEFWTQNVKITSKWDASSRSGWMS